MNHQEHMTTIAPEEALSLANWLKRVGVAIATAGAPAWVELCVVRAGKPWGKFVSFEVTDANRVQGSSRLKIDLPVCELERLSTEVGIRLSAPMLEGQVLLAKIVPRFSPTWHLSAEVLALHGSVAQGLSAARKDALRAALQQRGLYDAQKRLALPDTISRIALIAPPGVMSR
jgi:hypothetical protein